MDILGNEFPVGFHRRVDMSVRHCLLAILDQGPCYGYQLRGEFERRTGSTRPLNVGQIYNTLDRLERDGLVQKVEPSGSNALPSATQSGGARSSGARASSQIYYQITDAGTAATADWFATAVERSVTAPEELALKLAIAVTLPGVDAANVIRVQRGATAAELQELTAKREAKENPASSEEFAQSLIADSLILHAEAELAWLDRSASRLARAVESGDAAPMPLNTRIPKRGRPSKSRA